MMVLVGELKERFKSAPPPGEGIRSKPVEAHSEVGFRDCPVCLSDVVDLIVNDAGNIVPMSDPG